ncbi:hypothetical protein Pla123a_07460 [Posidoniimonas polymericola]|uniref:PEP-CTERM protein-sorting domain-containing protein n=1 Tax=Posidoniimonas polymericola TaxID=2528002 RepID=A0A5C5ZES6_9BACT|nr:PEP-CTERM sorting domain-containing protein [Posidoniimonas polymericola]TWT85939.1 hypothetical protein Pla123a_07460 [Posidoniimonas polymericola]
MRLTLIIVTVLAAFVAAGPAAAEVGYLLPELNVPISNANPVSGSFDVRLAVSGAEVGLPASAFAVELSVGSSDVTLGDATGPANPLFTGGTLLNFSDSSQAVQAAQDLYSSNPGSAPLVDGKGLLSVPFSIATPTVGEYSLSFGGLNELADDAGAAYALNVSDVGSISVFLSGDFNRDGSVDAADYTVWRDSQGDPVAAYAAADGDGDGLIDDDDLLVWKGQYGASIPSLGAATAAPEAASLALVGLGGWWVAGRRKRRRGCF